MYTFSTNIYMPAAQLRIMMP